MVKSSFASRLGLHVEVPGSAGSQGEGLPVTIQEAGVNTTAQPQTRRVAKEPPEAHDNGVKLPHIIKPTRYTLGTNAIKALRTAEQSGLFPVSDQPEHHPYRTNKTSTTDQPRAFTGSAPAGSQGAAGLTHRSSSSPFSTNTSLGPAISLGSRRQRAAAGSITSTTPSINPTSAYPVSPPSPGQSTLTSAAQAEVAPKTEAAPGEEAEEEDSLLPTLALDDDDELNGRLLSLPNIMCHAANGDVFLVGLGEVQTMLHRRRLGPEGLSTLRKFEKSCANQWEFASNKEAAELDAATCDPTRKQVKAAAKHGSDTGAAPPPGSPKTRAVTHHGARTGALSGAAADAADAAADADLAMSLGGAGLTPELEAEVAAHLEASMAAVEEHRQHLISNSARALAEVARQQAAALSEERKAKAVEFVVKQLVPSKLLAMANTRRAKAGVGNQLFRRMKQSLADINPETPKAGGLSGESMVRGQANWSKLKAKTDDVFSSMSFIADWNDAISKLKKTGQSGWDELLMANSVYVKGSTGDGAGSAVYVSKCQALGVVPSTQVVQQLRCVDANMAHCKLGRLGAQALRHALSTNSTITSLDLSDNALDHQAVAEIIGGLTAGTMANISVKARRNLQERWQQLDWVKAFKKPDIHLSVPASVKQVGQEQETEPKAPPSPTSKLNSPSKTGPDPNIFNEIGSTSMNESQPPTPAAPLKASILSSYLSRVQVLDLSKNQLGMNGAKAMANLLNITITPHQFLIELRLNKCAIPEAGAMAIFEALSMGNQTLRKLCMSNNAAGNASAVLLGQLLSVNRSLKELDMSWNQLKPDGVQDLCQGLEHNSTLEWLDLSWNGLEDSGVVRLGQMLTSNSTLKYLNLTNTRMGADACLMLGEGIKVNTTLEELILNGNAVGDDGARHLMSALKSNNTLQFLGLQGSNMSSATRGGNGASEFNPLAPDGSYTLLLAQPADRAVATQLCALDAASKTDLMRNIHLEGRNIASAKSQRWPDQLPTAGTLKFDFVTRRSQRVVSVMDMKKFQALIGQLDSRTMADKEKGALLDVMAPFTYLNCNQIALVLRCFSMGDELVRAAALMFTRAADLEDNVDMMTAVMQERDIHSLHQTLGWYSYFRFSNPSGHYELNLTTHVHQAMAARLKDVAFSEPSDGNNWINIIHDLYSQCVKVEGNFGPPEAWKSQVPTRGTLSFDFVSNVLPPDDAEAISDDQLVDFLHHSIGIIFTEEGIPMPEQDFAEADVQVALLRQEVGHQFYFTCIQVARVMSCFAAGPHKIEVAVLLSSLILDRKSFYIIMYSLRAVEQGVLMWRLGVNTFFDKNHPSGHYILDLSNSTHEQIARRLVDQAQNSDIPNFWNIRLQGCKKSIVENRNMWGSFTAETFTPWLEFDFIGTDAPEYLLNRPKAEWEAASKGERLDVVTKLAHRLEMQRVKDLYGYFSDGSGWMAPLWATGNQLFKPLINKPPWLAAWDRLARLLVRSDVRSGDIANDSALEDIFFDHCNDDGELNAQAFDALCKEWGYTKSEMHFHFRPLFDAMSQPSPNWVPVSAKGEAPPQDVRASTTSIADVPKRAVGSSPGAAAPAAQAEAPMVLDYSTFVEVIMREPPPDVRFKEVPVATNVMAVSAAAKALKNLKAKVAAKK